MRSCRILTTLPTLWLMLTTLAGPGCSADAPVPASTLVQAVSSDVPAYQVRLHQGGTTLSTLVSHVGTASTQSDGAGPAVRGAIARYADQQLFLLDYDATTYSTLSLDQANAAKTDEMNRLAGPLVVPEIGPVAGMPAAATLDRLPLDVHIAGHPTRAVSLAHNGRSYRLYFAADLPRPPSAWRKKIISILPGKGKGGSHCDDDDDDCDDEHATAAQQVAGRALLRVEVQRGAGWQTVLDADSITQMTVPRSTFDPPAGWIAAAAARPLVAAAGYSADVRYGGGPIVSHGEIHVFMWGRTFADPAHSGAVSELLQAQNRMVGTDYIGPLSEYGVDGAKVVDSRIDGDDPPASAGSSAATAAVVGNFVLDQALGGNGPLLWWSFGGHDPLYQILAPDAVLDQDGWSGYHLGAPVPVETLAPFPFNYLVHDELPYAFSRVPEEAMSMPLEGPLFRDQCLTASPQPPSCAIQPFFDTATGNMSHEMVEALTDPEPFFGYSDVGKVPVWDDGEIADICQNASPYFPELTRLTDTVVATYWSNNRAACIPGVQVQLAILSPVDKSNLTWQAGGTPLTLLAHATDTVDGPLQVSWTIDNNIQVTTISDVPQTQPLLKTLGAHQVQALVIDSQGISAMAAVTVNVVASPARLVMDSPADGATVGAGQLFALRAIVDDPQDGDLLDSQLSWSINGNPVGTGHLVLTSLTTLGDATVKLVGTDSAGLSTTVIHTVHVVPAAEGPEVVITSPADASVGFQPHNVIHFTAKATDADGSPIPDANIVWSDEDGVLGTGARLDYVVPDKYLCILAQVHVKVTVTGAGGKTASDTITLNFGDIC